MHRQVDRARSLLATKLPIAEFAVACDFASQQHFVTAYCKVVGVTPGQYRAALAQD